MKQISTDAIMLKRLNFGEADRIITLLTSDHGKVSVLAKGVRRSKSKLAGGLELFSVSTITYIDGKSDLKTVISTKLQAHFSSIVSDVARTMLGYDFLKAIDNFTDHVDDPTYYRILNESLRSLSDTAQDGSVVSVWFFTQVLRAFGGGINVERPVSTESFAQDQLYNFSYDDMSFFPHASGQFAPNHIKFLRLVLRSDSPNLLTNIDGGAELAQELLPMLKQSTMMHKA